MHAGRFILSQVLDLIDRKTLARLATHFNASSRVRHFGVRQQLICMVFAQLTWRDGLRDIVECLNAKHEALYHLGFREPVAKSTLADANERRDWRLWEALALSLIPKARSLYAGEDLGLDLEHTIYALDSTTIDLSLTMFPWATFRSTKSGIKVHTQIDLRGPIPVCVFVSPASMHDVKWLDMLVFESGAIYLFDKGYIDFARLQRIAASGAFFVTRAKENLRFARQESRPVNKTLGLRSDQLGYLALLLRRFCAEVFRRLARSSHPQRADSDEESRRHVRSSHAGLAQLPQTSHHQCGLRGHQLPSGAHHRQRSWPRLL